MDKFDEQAREQIMYWNPYGLTALRVEDLITRIAQFGRDVDRKAREEAGSGHECAARKALERVKLEMSTKGYQEWWSGWDGCSTECDAALAQPCPAPLDIKKEKLCK